MEKFEIGDIVICIKAGNLGRNGTPPPLREGNEYIVSGIKKCKCGVIKLDVGLVNNAGGPRCQCGHLDVGDIWWCYSGRFKKKLAKQKSKTIELSEITIEDLLKENINQ
jgi:hypothetical protein